MPTNAQQVGDTIQRFEDMIDAFKARNYGSCMTMANAPASSDGSGSGLPEDVKKKIAAISIRELLLSIGKRSVAIFDEHPGKQGFSSGTLIQIMDRVFIMTSAHNIPAEPSSRLSILPNRPRPHEQGLLRPGKHGKDTRLDLGFLEVPAEAVEEYFEQKECCTLGQLKDSGNGDSAQLTVLVGTPTQFIELNPTEDGPPFVARITAFASTPLSVSEWPSTFQGRNPDRASDILMPFPDNDCFRVDTYESIEMKSPEGFSGGGLWSAEFEKNGVWSPDSAKLIGIQVSWDSGQRIAKATQMIHWLNLLRSKLPELSEHLEENFPELKSMEKNAQGESE